MHRHTDKQLSRLRMIGFTSSIYLFLCITDLYYFIANYSCKQFTISFSLCCINYQKVIEPFPRPNKNASAQQTSIQLTTDLNSCDIDYVQKSISAVLSKPHETNDLTQSSQMTNEAMKENVIRELLETEENYVKLLSSLCIGYVLK